MASYWH